MKHWIKLAVAVIAAAVNQFGAPWWALSPAGKEIH